MPTQYAHMEVAWFVLFLSCFSVGSLLFCSHFDSVMEGHMEQRAVLKFLVKSGNMPISCWCKLKEVFGQNTMSKGRVRVWHKQFTAGDDRIKDKPKSGCPRSARSEENVRAVQAFLNNNRAVNLQDVAEHVQISVSSAHRMLKKDIKLSKLSPKFVPKVLTQAQKDVQKRACEHNLELLKTEPNLLETIITGDESWVSVYEIPSKNNSSEWLPKGTHRDHPVKALPQRNEHKSMLTLFFDKRGVVHTEFAPRGQRITLETYCKTLKVLKERIRKKRPDLWRRPNRARHGLCPFRLHHDNASSHTVAPTLDLLRDSDIQTLEHPPNSPDLAPCDYFVFPRLKNTLRGIRHPDVPAMQAAVASELKKIPKEEFATAIDALPVRWMKCLKAEGEYFEGRGVQINPEGNHGLVFDEESSESSNEEEESQNPDQD